MIRTRLLVLAAIVACTAAGQVRAAELYGLTPGPVDLQSVGPMAFGPDGVLFVSDTKAAKIYALAVVTDDKGNGHLAVGDLDDAIAKITGGPSEVVDMAVDAKSSNVFLGVSTAGKPALLRVSGDGAIAKVSLDKIGNSSVGVPNAPEDKMVQRGRRRWNPRSSCITDLAYTDGKVLVAGIQSGDSPSAVREFDFPFRDQSQGMGVEIYHAAHGRDENYAAIQTFVPFNIGGEPSLLAGYTCTPLVKIPIGKITANSQVKGTTVAELGNRNRPLDMIHYKSDGKDYLLMANSARGVMKISTDGLEENDGLTERVSGGGTAGQAYETIEGLEGVVQLAKMDDTHAVVVIKTDDESLLRTIHLP